MVSLVRHRIAVDASAGPVEDHSVVDHRLAPLDLVSFPAAVHGFP